MRALVASLAATAALSASALAQQMHVSFLWHMHQPIYAPYMDPLAVDGSGMFSFSVTDVHNMRVGPYTWWPTNAINAGLSLPHLGAQVSFSGSLIENLNALAGAGVNGGMWSNWTAGYLNGRSKLTTLGNRRLDLVAFGYHHPLMPLLDERDIRMQIKLHKHASQQTWGPDYSVGMFPPETAFHTRIIPALVAEGVDWVMVDNIHFDRACVGYPHTNASNLFPPNPADQINPDPATTGGAWVQLQNLWAPSKVSAPFGYRPHYAQHIDPETGQATQMVVVPAARYEGNEDGRGGYGAFLYDQVMDALLPYNTDPDHPMLVLLHHDGDNFGGGSEAYYNHNFQNMVSWAQSDTDYDVTTIEDYLERFPVDPTDIIHVEAGSWAGADNGDPEFKKWLGDPDGSGVSPDIHSWAVLTAAKNRVFTADDLAPHTSIANIVNRTGSATEQAWAWLLVSQASDYWYWDGTEVWDSNVTRGSNQAAALAQQVINANPGNDPTAPTVFLPQREPYNPGGFEWNPTPEPSDFEVWTLIDDVSGLTRVELKYRVDLNGQNPLGSAQNETYAGGSEVGAWQTVAMSASNVPTPAGVLTPSVKADRFSAMITGESDVLIDYYVEAEDAFGNVTRSDIQHVYVGTGTAGGPGNGDGVVTLDPETPTAGESVSLTYDPAGRPLDSAPQVFAHIGFNEWQNVVTPDPAMTFNGATGLWEVGPIDIPSDASQIDLAFTDGNGTWDNNGGQGIDWHFDVQGAAPPPFQMDGVSNEQSLTTIAQVGSYSIRAALSGTQLYVNAPTSRNGNDHFIYIAAIPGGMQNANWGKSGQIAAWDAFLADEHDNDYSSWFDTGAGVGVATGPAGDPNAVLEGVIDLQQHFGTVPETIAIALGVYQTADGGSLVPSLQVPASINSDANLDAGEYVIVTLSSIDISPASEPCPGDVDGDGETDTADITLVVSNLGAGAPGAAGTPGDADGDGETDTADITFVVSNLGTQCQ
ncbi:MAG: dockerin type I domain-containing protein [Planctomycetota bacterium]